MTSFPNPDVVLCAIEAGIATITLNRPERNNAWTNELGARYLELLNSCNEDPTVRAIVVTGAGRSFCPGADMNMLSGFGALQDAPESPEPPRDMIAPDTLPSYLAALIVGSFVGYLVGAWLADRIGRRNLFLTFSLGAIAVILLYTQLPLTNEVLWLLGFPLGFFASGYFSGVGAFLTELYPTRLRGSGQGFCYNFGRGIGALFPLLVGVLSNTTSLGNAIAIFAVAAYGVFFLAAFALPETRGRILHADA